MMNKEEEYKKTLIDMWDSIRITNKGGYSCDGVLCGDCPLSLFDGCSSAQDIFDIYRVVNRWGKEHQQKKYKLSKLEHDILKYLYDNDNAHTGYTYIVRDKDGHALNTLLTHEYTEHMYIARDKDGGICLYNEEPKKIGNYWYGGFVCSVTAFDELFQFVQWEDEKPTLIQYVLENCEVIDDDTDKRQEQ